MKVSLEASWGGSLRSSLLLQAIRSLYKQSRNLGRIACNKAGSFPMGVYLHQGCPLSPILVICFTERISRRRRRGRGCPVRWTRDRVVFADDVVLLASSSRDLQLALWVTYVRPYEHTHTTATRTTKRNFLHYFPTQRYLFARPTVRTNPPRVGCFNTTGVCIFHHCSSMATVVHSKFEQPVILLTCTF